MDKRPILILSLLLITLYGCWQKGNNSKKRKQDDFYTDPGSWDWQRIPLVKPYELNRVISRDEVSKWSIGFHNSVGTYNVKLVDVKDSIIYLISGSVGKDNDSTVVGSENVPTGWFIIDTKQNAEKGFYKRI